MAALTSKTLTVAAAVQAKRLLNDQSLWPTAVGFHHLVLVLATEMTEMCYVQHFSPALGQEPLQPGIAQGLLLNPRRNDTLRCLCDPCHSWLVASHPVLATHSDCRSVGASSCELPGSLSNYVFESARYACYTKYSIAQSQTKYYILKRVIYIWETKM